MYKQLLQVRQQLNRQDLRADASSTDENYLPIQEFILVSEAPIDTAVKLAECYENFVEKEKDRSRDLQWAEDFCDQIAIDLLSIIAKVGNASAVLRARDYKNVIDISLDWIMKVTNQFSFLVVLCV